VPRRDLNIVEQRLRDGPEPVRTSGVTESNVKLAASGTGLSD